MSTTTTKTSTKGVRYTADQKKETVDFALDYNATNNGRGGLSKAAEKFGISQITVAAWLKAAGAPALNALEAPKETDAPKEPKVLKEPKASKAPKATKESKAGSKKPGTRYTDEQKKEVTDFVTEYNDANGGRGGPSKAAKKFSVSPLTVVAWLKAAGVESSAKKTVTKGVRYIAPGKRAKLAQEAKYGKPTKAGKAAGKAAVKVAGKATGKVLRGKYGKPLKASPSASGDFNAKLSSLLALSEQIVEAQGELAELNAKFDKLKASL